MFSNQTHSFNTLKNSLQRGKLGNHRVFLVLPNVTDQYFSEICDEVKRLINEDTLSEFSAHNCTETQPSVNIMHVPNGHSNSDSADHINAVLGSEYKCIFFDAVGVFDERLFAACAGTVLGGGIMTLRTPSLTHWAAIANKPNPSLFISRIVRKILSHQTGVLSEPAIPETGQTEQSVQAGEQAAILIANTATDTDTPTPASSWAIEQEELVNQLLTALLDKRQTTAVVQADRGRGKSTLIGLTLNQLFADENGAKRSVTLTSNRSSACTVLLQHAAGAGTGTGAGAGAGAGAGGDGDGGGGGGADENDHPIQFMSIEQALSMQHDVLVVEEAGGISIPVLTKLTALAHDIVFATTVQGYEGAGRGFALRFSKQLDQLRPGWLMLSPQHPIRWSDNDPLETFVNDALLLKTSLPTIAQSAALNPENACLTQISKHALSTDDQLLEEIYSLLIQAHYQTTPADLRNMIDKEQLLIFTQRTDNTLTGAVLVALEGNIPVDLHEAIVQKKRRIADQILPQLLAQSAADSTVLPHSFARIVRIAIHPNLQRQGFGTTLFKQLQNLLAVKTHSIGASFGADDQTLSFWLKLGLTPIHYGYKANPRSGLRSACLIKSYDPTVMEVVNKAASILNKNLSVLNSHANAFDAVRQQLLSATRSSDTRLSDVNIEKLISDFCQSKRSFIDTVGFIHPNIAKPSSSDTAELINLNNPANTIEQHINTLLKPGSNPQPQQRRIAEQAVREFIMKNRLS